MQNAGKQKLDFGVNATEFRNYLHDLYVVEYDQRVLANKTGADQGGHKKNAGNNGNNNDNKHHQNSSNPQGKESKCNCKDISKCPHCSKFHPGACDGYWTLDKNKDKRPDGYQKPGKENTEIVQSLKSHHNVEAEIAQDRKCQKVSSNIHNIKYPSNVVPQANSQGNKWK